MSTFSFEPISAEEKKIYTHVEFSFIVLFALTFLFCLVLKFFKEKRLKKDKKLVDFFLRYPISFEEFNKNIEEIFLFIEYLCDKEKNNSEFMEKEKEQIQLRISDLNDLYIVCKVYFGKVLSGYDLLKSFEEKKELDKKSIKQFKRSYKVIKKIQHIKGEKDAFCIIHDIIKDYEILTKEEVEVYNPIQRTIGVSPLKDTLSLTIANIKDLEACLFLVEQKIYNHKSNVEILDKSKEDFSDSSEKSEGKIENLITSKKTNSSEKIFSSVNNSLETIKNSFSKSKISYSFRKTLHEITDNEKKDFFQIENLKKENFLSRMATIVNYWQQKEAFIFKTKSIDQISSKAVLK